MLCSLSISAWSDTSMRETSDEIAELHAAEKDAGRYNKRLVPRDALNYFRGPGATLFALLRDAIRCDACQVAEQLAVKEVRFKRTAAEPFGWTSSWSLSHYTFAR